MPDAPQDADRRSNAEPGPSSPRSRTAAAGREFLHALGSDLAALARTTARAPLFTLACLRAVLLTVAGSPAVWARVGGRIMRNVGVGIAVFSLGGALVLSGAMLWALRGLPLDGPSGERAKPTLLLEASTGEPLGRIGPLRTADVPLQDFPASLIQAVLSIEDHRFYDHFGVDPLGILRAAHRNAAAGGIVEGGSTITQQLVKLRYVGNDRTYLRKLREALTAVWLEARLGKDEILTRYLNSVYLGAGAYGMSAASQLYFDKRPADLTLAEAAMLAGLIKAPSQFNPLRDLQAAQTRAATVLDAMVAAGAIDERAANAAKASPATLKVSPQLAPGSPIGPDVRRPRLLVCAAAEFAYERRSCRSCSGSRRAFSTKPWRPREDVSALRKERSSPCVRMAP